MSFLTSEQPPESFEDDAKEYLTRVFTQVDTALNNKDLTVRRTDLAVQPLIGKSYYFNNAAPSIPAITGEGLWLYKSTGWVLLG